MPKKLYAPDMTILRLRRVLEDMDPNTEVIIENNSLTQPQSSGSITSEE